MEFPIPEDHKGKIKESETMNEYMDFGRELKHL